MNHEIKSGELVIATITARQVVAFQVNIPGDNDMQSVLVPVWANTVAIDEDGSIWAYESTAEDVRILDDLHNAWVDCGKCEANMQQVGLMGYVPDWKETKVDLRGLK
ncbi:hypothetical protein [Klebsiella phage vB_KpnS-VAC2]|uniref:Uncharacterized protein n=1 Tax=Klebsiella phage vB_KpnS-VAC2 TaxID=2864369 RepID=A0AAE7XHJ0_9CAUD|nr:hypothetical protein [Klebsiella phage vB_KpnS-VAC2]